MEEITFDQDARDKLISGVTKLAKAVGSTMGPHGTTVVIPTDSFGKYKVTKDGVSVAREIFFKDPIENIGAQLVKQSAEQTLTVAGDGTTTATVLTAAFVNNLKSFPTKDINKAFDEIIPKVLEQLKANSRELRHEDIKHVATISANNDIQIGDIIQQAYNHSSIVKVEESNNNEDSVELINGMSLNVSYFSKYFINNDKKAECKFENPYVLLLDGKLENLKSFEGIITNIAEQNESLLIVTEHVNENTLRLLESNVLKGSLKVCVIKAPGFSKHRKDLLRDLSDFTGATLITDLNKQYPSNILGRLQSCSITKHNSILTKHESVNIDDIIETLEGLRFVDSFEDIDKDLLNKRIENLKGSVSVIKVGGVTENEMKERFDRYDDAVKAVACALEEGIVEGGGVVLRKIANRLRLNYVVDSIEDGIQESLSSPYENIINNGSIIDIVNMFEQNIIDPLKVTRCALENAVSVAKVILSTNAVVLSRSEWT